jgi:type II secretory pathway component PulJ
MTLRRRHGFSLLEVLLATSILIGSAIVLMELVSIGSRHASSARDLVKSQLICQTKLNEVLARVVPAETVRPTPVEDEPEWVYWIDVQPLKQPGLVALEVNAAHEPQPNKQSARFTLIRWVRDPQANKALENQTPQTDPNAAPADATSGAQP